jgi:hypothetical protein
MVVVPFVALREGFCHVAAISIGALHQASASGLGFVTGYTGVALPEPLFDIIPCLKPIIPLPDLVQSLINTPVFSCWFSMEFSQYILHLALK